VIELAQLGGHVLVDPFRALLNGNWETLWAGRLQNKALHGERLLLFDGALTMLGSDSLH
jgi:hypothetical protein